MDREVTIFFCHISLRNENFSTEPFLNHWFWVNTDLVTLKHFLMIPKKILWFFTFWHFSNVQKSVWYFWTCPIPNIKSAISQDWLYVISSHIRVTGWFYTLELPECHGTPCLKQVPHLKFMWQQQDSNPQPHSV